MVELIELIGVCYRVELPEPQWLELLAQSAARAFGGDALACVCAGRDGERLRVAAACSTREGLPRPEVVQGPLSVQGKVHLINGCNADGVGVVVVLATRRRLARARTRAYACVASHLGAAMRLRRRLERVDALTRREQEVLAAAARGHHNKLIAYDLGLAHSTVRVLLHRAATKLGAGSRSEAVARWRSWSG